MNFRSLGLSNSILSICNKIGYNDPTDVQLKSIPTILKNRNVLVSSETGSGKTAAFGFPILSMLSNEPYSIYCIIISPTRELAFQIYEKLSLYGTGFGLKICCFIGGIDIMKNKNELESLPHIIVGTPGRISSIMDEEKYKHLFENTHTIVIDEADQVMDLQIDMKKIITNLPNLEKRILTSATITKENHLKIANYFFEDEKTWKLCISDNRFNPIDTLKQNYLFIPKYTKEFYLYFLLSNKFENIQKIVFVRTCKGLDIPFVDIVINFDVPNNPQDYIHRVGRTARQGKRGASITFIDQFEINLILEVEKLTGEKLKELKYDEEKVLEESSTYIKAKNKAKLVKNDFNIAND